MVEVRNVEAGKNILISGGYLKAETSEDNQSAIKCGTGKTFTNSGGVLKATGKNYGIEGNCNFAGGVTIANGTTGAISGSITGDNSEKLFATIMDNGVGGGVLSSASMTNVGKLLVIAKTAQSTQYQGITADGVYVKMALGVAWEPTGNASVSGGSYFEGTQNGFYSAQGHSVYINKTLVCVATGTEGTMGEGLNTTSGKVTMGANATLYGEFKGTVQKAGITANGGIIGAAGATGYDVIGVTSGGETQGIWAPVGTADKPIKGNVVAINSNTGAGNALAQNVYVGDGGTVTAISAGSGATLDLAFSVAEAGRLTAVNTGSGGAYSGSKITGSFTVTGEKTNYLALKAVDFTGTTYGIDGQKVNVLFVKGHKDSWVGDEDFRYADKTASGTGWTWNKSTKTLTLSGVNAERVGEDGIHIEAPSTDTVTLVLEGANKAAAATDKMCGLDCSGSLIIKGSGTLEASSTTGVYAMGINATKDLTIESGHITASGVLSGICSNEGSATVSGGYVSATATPTADGSGGVWARGGYSQTGGYVKAVSNGEGSGLITDSCNATITVSGGYLEAKGSVAIRLLEATATFTNSGGVVKATGTGAGSTGIKGACTFTGGVTIASGKDTGKAINGTTATGAGDKAEKVWTLTDGVASEEATIGSTITGASVVIAKAITSNGDVSNLDGVYIFSDNATALSVNRDVTVTGGCYLETGVNTEYALLAADVNVTGTLVCECKDAEDNRENTKATLSAKNIDVKSGATLYGFAAAKIAIMAKENPSEIKNAGNLIGESNGAGILSVNENLTLTITGGYTCGISHGGGQSFGILADEVAVTGGYITGIGSSGVWTTTSADVTGKAVITAVGTDAAYCGKEILSGKEKAAVIGSITPNSPMSAATFPTVTPLIYKIDNSYAKVLLIKGKTPPPPVPYTPSSTTVIVDGKSETIGRLETSGNDKNVVVDADKLTEKVAAAKSGSEVQVIVPAATGRASAQLVVKNVEDMAKKDIELTVTCGDVTYTVPTGAIDTAAIMKELGAGDAAKVPVSVTIAKVGTDVVKNNVEKVGAEIVGAPVEFTVTATFGGKTTEVTRFDSFVQRIIEVPEANAEKITTAVVADEDGKIRHVPTFVEQVDGKYFAKINSRTNSTYALIYSDTSFKDAAGKWFEAVITEMASRKVINGRNDTTFDGDGKITRAEFAAIAVRALGLPADGNCTFTDVSKSAWYAGAVGTAAEYGLVSGRTATTYDPEAFITRQEAMQLIANAAKVAEYTGKTGELTAFSDAGSVASWAQAAAQFNVGSGLIVGSDGKLNPTANITRAETATVVLRLLQNAGLVDIRTKA